MTKEFSSGVGHPSRCHFHRPGPSATMSTGAPHHGMTPGPQRPAAVAFVTAPPRPAAFVGGEFVPLSTGLGPGSMGAVIGGTCSNRGQTRPAGQQQCDHLRHTGNRTASEAFQQIPEFYSIDLPPGFLEKLFGPGLCEVSRRPGCSSHGPCRKGQQSPESLEHQSCCSASSNVTCCKGKSTSEDKVENPTCHSAISKASQLASEQDGLMSSTRLPDEVKDSKVQRSFCPFRKQAENPTTWVHSMPGLGIFSPEEITVKVKSGKVVVHVRQEKSCGPGPCLGRLEMVKIIPLPDNLEQQTLTCVLKSDGTLQLTGQCRVPPIADGKPEEDPCGLQNLRGVNTVLEKAENETETVGPKCTEKAEVGTEGVPPEAKEAGNNSENVNNIEDGTNQPLDAGENEQDDSTVKNADAFAVGVKSLSTLASKSVPEIIQGSGPSTDINSGAQLLGEESSGISCNELGKLADEMQVTAMKSNDAEVTTAEVEMAVAQSPVVEFPDDDIESENELEMARSYVSQSSAVSDLEVINDLFDGCIEKDFQDNDGLDERDEKSLEESELFQREATEVLEDCDATPPLKRQNDISGCDDGRPKTSEAEESEENVQQSACDSISPDLGESPKKKEIQSDSEDSVDKVQKRDDQGQDDANCSNGAFRVLLPVMGFSPQDMQMKLKGRTLKFCAHRHAMLGEAAFTEGLERVIELPEHLDTSTVECKVRDDGFLVITALPKDTCEQSIEVSD